MATATKASKMSSLPLGGRHAESNGLRYLLADAGVLNPITDEPLTEALCFGIAGGIGAGYSFCPSVPRWGTGSGVAVVGRHKSYVTNGAFQKGCLDRLGVKYRVHETGGQGKAYQQIEGELDAGRPAIVWCSKSQLPFLGEPTDSCNLWMHSFVVTALDEETGTAVGIDRAPTPVTLSIEVLASARAGICSHKNRVLAIDPPKKLTKSDLEELFALD